MHFKVVNAKTVPQVSPDECDHANVKNTGWTEKSRTRKMAWDSWAAEVLDGIDDVGVSAHVASSYATETGITIRLAMSLRTSAVCVDHPQLRSLVGCRNNRIIHSWKTCRR